MKSVDTRVDKVELLRDGTWRLSQANNPPVLLSLDSNEEAVETIESEEDGNEDSEHDDDQDDNFLENLLQEIRKNSRKMTGNDDKDDGHVEDDDHNDVEHGDGDNHENEDDDENDDNSNIIMVSSSPAKDVKSTDQPQQQAEVSFKFFKNKIL